MILDVVFLWMARRQPLRGRRCPLDAPPALDVAEHLCTLLVPLVQQAFLSDVGLLLRCCDLALRSRCLLICDDASPYRQW